MFSRAAAESAEAVSFQSVLARGSSFLVKHLVWMIFENCKAKGTQAWNKMAWSFQALFEGKHPTHDPYGKKYEKTINEGQFGGTDLAEGFFAVIWGIKGDLDWYAKALKLNAYQAVNPCPYDNCCRDVEPALEPLNSKPGQMEI